MDSNKFKMHGRVAAKIVDLHQELCLITENCDQKTIPRDVVDIEIALAKSETVREALNPSKSIFVDDDAQPDITKVVPRHHIEAQTKFDEHLLLMSASQIDLIPICAETKVMILGAQIEFIKALRRFRFIRAYQLYKYIKLWKTQT